MVEVSEAAAGGGSKFAERIAALTKELRAKKTFCAACRGIAEVCEQDAAAVEGGGAAVEALSEAGKVAFLVVQSRFSNPKFWQAALDLFLALESALPTASSKWIETAMEEVDDEARERAKQQKQLRRVQEDRAHNKGRWSDANTRATMEELLAAAGLVVVEDDGRPGMSRDAQNELRVVTVLEEDICVVCQEAMPAGSKAKAMPCGHKFHDECLLAWVKKSNSCPTCRYDEMPSEKRHFDDVQRAVQTGPARSSLYA